MKKPPNQRQRLALEAMVEPEGLSAQVLRFLHWADSQRYSPATIYSQTYHLAGFAGWCRERGVRKFSQVDRQLLERYQRQFSRRLGRGGLPLSPVTIASVISSLRALFRYLVREGEVSENPAAELQVPRLGERLPRYVLSEEDVEHLFQGVDVSTKLGLRNRALLELLYSTGLRRAEVVKLEVTDLDFTRGTLLVRRGKGKKDRLVPLGVRAAMWVRRYLERSRPLLVGDPGERALFISSQTGTALSKNFIGRMVKNYLEAVDLGGRGACHLLRHTMATLMLENGADIRYIQQMLGHALLSTTQIYTKVALSKMQEVHRRTHPSERSRTARWLRRQRSAGVSREAPKAEARSDEPWKAPKAEDGSEDRWEEGSEDALEAPDEFL